MLILKRLIYIILQHIAFRICVLLGRNSSYFKLENRKVYPITNTTAFQHAVTWIDTALLYDQKFEAAYPRLPQMEAHHPRDFLRYRFHVAAALATSAAKTPGDMLFLGVAYGINAKTVLNFVSPGLMEGKTVFLVDAWEGLWTYTGSDTPMQCDQYPSSVEEVRPLFAAHDNVQFIQGIAPGCLAGIGAERKFCYVEMDTADCDAEVQSLELIWPRVAAGGVVVMDSYALGPELRASFDKLFARLGVYPLLLLSGQAVLLKR